MRSIPGFVIAFAIVLLWTVALKLAADHLDRTVPVPTRPTTAPHMTQER